LIPEVVWLGSKYEQKLINLISLRISYKLGKYKGEKDQGNTKQQILTIKEQLKNEVEKELSDRLVALRRYLRSPDRDPHLSLQEIFRTRPSRATEMADTLFEFIRQLKKSRSRNVTRSN
jgi:hypothetical protein